MARLHSILARIAAMFRRRELDERIDDELRFHIEMQTEENIRRGMSPTEARRRARIESGGVEQVKELHRDVRGLPFLAGLGQDLRYAVRSFSKSPGFTATVLTTLALGVGVGTAIFSIVNAVLIHPLPYQDPDRLVMVWNVNEQKGYDREQQRTLGLSMSGRQFLEWHENFRGFEEMAAIVGSSSPIEDASGREPVAAPFVSPGFFDLLGVQPILGRAFLPEENQKGADRAIILQYDFWQRRFGGRSDVIGATLRDQFYGPVTVVGVMPPDFVFFNREYDAFKPMIMDLGDGMFNERNAGAGNLRVVARFGSGVSLEQVQAQADVFAAQLDSQRPEAERGWRVELTPLADESAEELRPAVILLFVSVGLLMVVVCANIAGLLLVRAVRRAREFALRSAIGAGPLRLVRQLLTESLLLSGTGACLGLGIAYVVVDYFRAVLPDRSGWGRHLVHAEAIQIDSTVIGFAVAVAVAAGLIFGLMPAVRASSPRLDQTLRESGPGGGGARSAGHLRSALLSVQVALAVVLVVGAALLMRSMYALYDDGLGFDPERVVTLGVLMPIGAVNEEIQARNMSREEGSAFYRSASWTFFARVKERIEQLPGVKSVALGSSPIGVWTYLNPWTVEGEESARAAVETQTARVGPGHFEVLRIPLLRGRLFDDRDVSSSTPVAVVSEQAARTLWPGSDPIGKRFRRSDPKDAPWETVIGIVGDVRFGGLGKPFSPHVYRPIQPSTPSIRRTFVIRSSVPPSAIMPSLRSAVLELEPLSVVEGLGSLEEQTRDSAWRLLYSTMLLGGLAVLSLVLSVVGIYGVVSYAVGERTREFGLRVALGASRTQVLWSSVWHVLPSVTLGLVIGFAAAVAGTRLLGSLLYGIGALDPISFVGVAIAFAAAALLASYIPARRAASIDPMMALRHE